MRFVYAFFLIGLFSIVALGRTQSSTSQAQTASPTVTDVGAINAPGIYQLKGASLLEALAVSRGLQPSADIRSAQIIRSIPPTAGNTKPSETIMVDLHAVLTGGVADLKLKPGDVIYVPS